MDIALKTNSEESVLIFQDIECFDDKSSYHAELIVKSRGFSASRTIYFEPFQLNEFIKHLKKMNANVKGYAKLEPMFEKSFYIELVCNRIGQINVRGEIIEQSPQEQCLKFDFTTDQTCLNPLINDFSKCQQGNIPMVDIPKDTSIQKLIGKIEERFGPDIFRIQPGSDPNVIGFKSVENEQLYISVVSDELADCHYSVQVTLEGDSFKKFIAEVDGTRLYMPFDIVKDKKVGLEGLIELFEKYRITKAPSWNEIYELEVNGEYPSIIEALEDILKENPNDKEAVIRLGFHYWYITAEYKCLKLNIPFDQYTARFRELLETYKDVLCNDADFCFSYGLGLYLFFFNFATKDKAQSLKVYESLGKKLLKRAAKLDPFYKRFNKSKATQEDIAQHFSGRGCFLKYYTVI